MKINNQVKVLVEGKSVTAYGFIEEYKSETKMFGKENKRTFPTDERFFIERKSVDDFYLINNIGEKSHFIIRSFIYPKSGYREIVIWDNDEFRNNFNKLRYRVSQIDNSHEIDGLDAVVNNPRYKELVNETMTLDRSHLHFLIDIYENFDAYYQDFNPLTLDY